MVSWINSLYNGSVNHIIARKEVTGLTELSPYPLNYAPGGTRAYAGKYFVKQATIKELPDGTKVIGSPLTHRVSKRSSSAQEHVNHINNTIDARKEFFATVERLKKESHDGKITRFTWPAFKAAKIRANAIIAKQGLFSDLDDLKRGIDEGEIALSKAEVVFDREQMAPVKGAVGLPKTEDIPMYHSPAGKLHYSAKGKFLPGDDGTLADLADPLSTLSRHIGTVVRGASVSDYARNQVPRWAGMYGRYLHVPGVEDPTPMELLRQGVWKSNTPDKVKGTGETLREYHNMIIGTPTDSSIRIKQMNRNLAKAIERKVIPKIPEKHQDTINNKMFDVLIDGKDKAGIIKGWVYDMHLGAFNPGQLFLQGSALIGVISISPKHGMGAFKDHAFLRIAAMNPRAREVAATAWSKLHGGADKKQFYGMLEDLRKSNLMDIGGTDTTLDRASSLANGSTSVGRGVNAVREFGRTPVYEGERINRLHAFGVARREALEKVTAGEFLPDSAEYHTYISGRSSDLLMNMVTGSEAYWQSNVFTTLPTQFWAYPTRVVESLLSVLSAGKVGNKTLTPRENAQFIMGQFGMWGFAGVPFATTLYQSYLERYGEKIDPEVYKTLSTGFFDLAIRQMSGGKIDPAFGATFGTSTFIPDLIEDIFEADTPYGLLTGVAGGDLSKLMEFTKRMVILSDAELSGDIKFTESVAKELAKLFRSTSNYTRSYYLYKYGVLYDSKAETPLAKDVDPLNILLTSLNIQTSVEQEFYRTSADSVKHTKMLREVSKIAAQARLEAINKSLEPGVTDEDLEPYYNKVTAILKPFMDDPQDMKFIRSQLRKELGTDAYQVLVQSKFRKFKLEGEE
jgi:hypothetical protein